MLGENAPRRLQKLAHRADVDIAVLVKREVSPREGAVLTYRLVDNRDVRRDLLLIDDPVEHRSRPVGALVASVADPKAFQSGRNFSAWIGLVPKQHSSGGKDRLGSISKQGDRYLRGLFVAGALAVIRYAKIHGTKHRPWLTALLARRPTKVAAIALANKIARMVWAMMAKGERYKEPVALAA